MGRALARLCLLLALVASVAALSMTAARIARDPALRPFRDATSAEIVAATDRMMAREATAAALARRIDARLADTPRNWVALDALGDIAAERRLALPPATLAALVAARDEDGGWMAQAASCAACVYDTAACSLDQLLFCRAPIELSPVGDLASVARAGTTYALGQDVDEIDLGLAIIGLGATAAVLGTGGSSATVKAGAGLVKMARRAGRLSPRLTDELVRAVRSGVEWRALAGVRSADDLARAIRLDAFRPLTETARDLNRLKASTDIRTTLHLLPLVDDASDARRLARAGEALGPKVVGRAELLGKARLLRATLRVTEVAWTLLGAFLTLTLTLAGLAGSFARRAAFRVLWRIAR